MPTKAKTLRQRRGRPAEHRGSAAARGYDAAWRKARAAQLRGEPLCRFCGDLATVADHARPLNQGGARLDPANLRRRLRRMPCEDHRQPAPHRAERDAGRLKPSRGGFRMRRGARLARPARAAAIRRGPLLDVR